MSGGAQFFCRGPLKSVGEENILKVFEERGVEVWFWAVKRGSWKPRKPLRSRQDPREQVPLRDGSACLAWENKGFTLWELLLVLALMGFLTGAFVPRFTSALVPIQKRAQEANAQKVEGALQLYRLDVGALPGNFEDLIRRPDGVKGWQGPYLKEWPLSGPPTVYAFDSYGRVTLSQ
ncbi:type II secretion system protein G precursor [Peptococcaceae bacterium CEB3]|nr:type II secretion system protein G precursor [Peptococcaceae bacterium CEB3]